MSAPLPSPRPAAAPPRPRARARRGRTSAALALALACAGALAPGTARAQPAVALRASFLPEHLGSGTALTLAFRVGVGEAAVPAPLRSLVAHLPAGLAIDLRGVPACPAARLRRGGPGACPQASLVGRGHARMLVHAGSQAISEQALVWVFRVSDRSGRPALSILSRGSTPLERSSLATMRITRERPPYGLRLALALPPVPTVVFEPDASLVDLSLTLGALGARPRAHTAAGAVLLPARCPAGGFPFAADFAFADETAARAAVRVPCPLSGPSR